LVVLICAALFFWLLMKMKEEAFGNE
jgi:hypothetical protein